MCTINTLSTDTVKSYIYYTLQEEEEREFAIILLQRLIRGCAVQNKVSRTSSYCTIDSTHLISQDV